VTRLEGNTPSGTSGEHDPRLRESNNLNFSWGSSSFPIWSTPGSRKFIGGNPGILSEKDFDEKVGY